MKLFIKANSIALIAFALLVSMGSVQAAAPQVLYNFLDGNDGGYPLSQLVQGTDGAYYGTTGYGGAYGHGTVFKWIPGKFTTLASFDYYTTGGFPNCGLIQGTDGNFYGTTYYGGANGSGTVYKITPGGKLTVLASFDYSNTGAYLTGPVVQGTDGNFYGTTEEGGLYGYGTIYRVKPNGNVKVLVNLDYYNTGGNGWAGLTLGKDGNFYGTISQGGPNNYGTVFRMTPNGSFKVLASLDYYTTGGYPFLGVTFGPDGALYSAASEGGTNNYGTLFSVSPSTMKLRVLRNFNSSTDGGYPEYGYYLLVNGNNIYGTNYYGGPNGYGTIYRYNVTPPGSFSVLTAFDNSNDGSSPYGGVIIGSDGMLYGTTYGGGKSGYGVLFRTAK